MAATEKHIRLAARLYEARDTAKRLLGDRYPQKMQELRKLIEDVQSTLHVGPLVAVNRICIANELGGVDIAYVMAAACEMIEPSVSQR